MALCDVDMGTLNKKGEKYPQAEKFQDFRKMFDKLGKSIDAVTVSTPDHMHAPVSVAAMQRGKHVFCQKPLATNPADSRVMMDADYTYLRGEVARLKKLQAEKSVSLNEEARLKEKNEAEARAAAHKKELIARKEPKEKIIKLSLKQVDQPGLPAPTVGTLTAQAAPKKKAAKK